MFNKLKSIISKLSLLVLIASVGVVFIPQDSEAKKISSRDANKSLTKSLSKISLDGNKLVQPDTGDEGPDVCESAEPQGMTKDYQKCSFPETFMSASVIFS